MLERFSEYLQTLIECDGTPDRSALPLLLFLRSRCSGEFKNSSSCIGDNAEQIPILLERN